MSHLKPLYLALCLALFTGNAHALDSIKSPNAEEGELEFEYKGSRTIDDAAKKDDKQEHEFAVEYGLTDRVMLELETELEKEPTQDTKVAKIAGEARFQFFEQGENWLDSGFLVGYDVGLKNRSPDVFKMKLLLEKDVSNFTNRANISLKQDIGDYSNANGPRYGFVFNSHYRFDKAFQPGLELQSDFGRANTLGHFRDQKHYIGPAAYGKILGNIKYEAAYLIGFSEAASQGAARFKLAYEMHF